MKHFSTLTTPGFGGHAQLRPPCLTSWLLVVLLALGAGRAQAQFGAATTYAVGTHPSGVAVGDVNGDGRLDIVTANRGDNNVSILLGQVSGGFLAGSTYSTGTNSNPGAVKLGDVNGDGRLDIVTAVATSTGNGVGVLLGQAAGDFGAVSIYAAGGNKPYSGYIALGDVNGDSRLDVLTTASDDALGVLLGKAAGGFAAVSTFVVSPGLEPFAIALGDVNGDGRLDVVTNNDDNTSTNGAKVAVALGQSAGGFAAAKTYATGGKYSGPVTLGDVNGDGRLDIVTNRYYVGFAVVLLGQSDGSFGNATAYTTTTGDRALAIALADVNGDGRLDILSTSNSNLTSSNNKVDVLLGQTSGFSADTPYPTGSDDTSDLAIGDVNKDGKPDIVVSNRYSNTVNVLLNQATFLATASAASAAAFALYPNPAHERATVRLPAGTEAVRLFDALGREVRHLAVATGATEATLDLRGLPTGLYVARALGSGPAATRRLVVE